jgi:hypothetical protein
LHLKFILYFLKYITKVKLTVIIPFLTTLTWLSIYPMIDGSFRGLWFNFCNILISEKVALVLIVAKLSPRIPTNTFDAAVRLFLFRKNVLFVTLHQLFWQQKQNQYPKSKTGPVELKRIIRRKVVQFQRKNKVQIK